MSINHIFFILHVEKCQFIFYIHHPTPPFCGLHRTMSSSKPPVGVVFPELMPAPKLPKGEPPPKNWRKISSARALDMLEPDPEVPMREAPPGPGGSGERDDCVLRFKLSEGELCNSKN